MSSHYGTIKESIMNECVNLTFVPDYYNTYMYYFYNAGFLGNITD